MASISRLHRAMNYLVKMHQVEGWLDETTALAMLEVSALQERLGVIGNLAEVGIHHGKSLIVLALAARAGETVHAIDLFEKQHLNVDASGQGNRERFLANLMRFCPGAEVTIVAESSLDIRGKENSFGLRNVRLFSVDGGHTRALTRNDLEIVDHCLTAQGVCFLDDVFNVHWSGVATGLFDFLTISNSLVPLAMFPNKLALCRPRHKAEYARHLRIAFDYALDKTAMELGKHHIDIFGARWPQIMASFAAVAALHAPPEDPAVAERLRNAEARAATAEAHAAELEQRLQELEESLRNRAAEHAAAVEAIRTSTSWRLTTPLRSLKDMMSGPRR